MSPSARGQYVARMQSLYREAKGRNGKSRVIVQVSETLACHRKHAGRLMRGKSPRLERPFRHRQPVYPERVVRILAVIWEASQHLWSVRLKAAMPLWMSWIEKRWGLNAEERKMLLAMSPATIDRRLAAHKRQVSRKIYGKTKPGRWLRQTIPIQTESWDVPEPGWLEADTVSHSGPTASGLWAYTLNEVDLFSGWVELRAMLGKEDKAIVAAADEIRQALPFEMKGMDTDNGEEFINYELDRYCKRTGVQRFRSRPYKKDDQAHIEQKNGTHVRRLIGWDRYDTQAAVDAMNDLYRNEWRLLTNLFLPSVKLANKLRVGSKIKRIYDDPKTPLDRLLDSQHGDRSKIERLRDLRLRLDPFAPSKIVDRKLQTVWSLATRGPIKASPAPYALSKQPWNDLVRRDAYVDPVVLQHDATLGRLAKSCWRDRFHGTN